MGDRHQTSTTARLLHASWYIGNFTSVSVNHTARLLKQCIIQHTNLQSSTGLLTGGTCLDMYIGHRAMGRACVCRTGCALLRCQHHQQQAQAQKITQPAWQHPRLDVATAQQDPPVDVAGKSTPQERQPGAKRLRLHCKTRLCPALQLRCMLWQHAR